MIEVEVVDGAAEYEAPGFEGLVGDRVVGRDRSRTGRNLSRDDDVFGAGSRGCEAKRGGKRSGDDATEKHRRVLKNWGRGRKTIYS